MTLDQIQFFWIIGTGICFIALLREMELIRDRILPVNIFALLFISITVWPAVLIILVFRIWRNDK